MDSMVGDIVERDSSAKPPQEPKPKPSTQGAPKKRWGERRRPVVLDPSAQQPAPAPRPRPGPARAQSTASSASSAASSPRAGQDAPLSDAERVHLENIRRMQQMTPEQIEQEREEIFRSMNPDVLQSLLRRAELKEQEQASAFDGGPGARPDAQPDAPASGRQAGPPPPAQAPAAPPGPAVFESQRLAKGATLDESEVDDLLGLNEPSRASAARTARKPDRGREAQAAPAVAEPAQPEDGAGAAGADAAGADAAGTDAAGADAAGTAAASTVHFPPPPEELRKYFPDLPVETEKLAWMQPIADEEEQEYSDQLVSVAPSELRFDFNGNLVTPRVSRLIDPSRGLHHHGDAPSAAGYTLPELAHLSRSAHPAQRAMAIQTVGRVLHKFRLRKFAKSSELQEGLDRLIKATRVMETLEEAADERTRSLTVRTYATEALWLANTGTARAP